MKILVSGGTGYIGQKLLKRLKEEGHELYVIVREQSNIQPVRKYVQDVILCRPYQVLYDACKRVKPELYINLAGCYYGTHTPERMDGLFEANVILPAYVMDAAVQAGCRSMIHTSSYQQCYGGERYHPINFYAATKQAFEDVMRYYTFSSQIKAVVLQLFDTYGEDDPRNKVFNLVRRLGEGDSIAMSPGEQKMYFCHIDDVTEAYRKAVSFLDTCQMGYYGKFSVRGEIPVSLKQWINEYLNITRKHVHIDWGARSYAEKEIMDPSGMGVTVPGWHPEISYREGLSRCGNYDLKIGEKNGKG